MSRVCDVCQCPEMTAGPHYTYFWTDLNGSNPVPMSAHDYITTLFQSISDLFHSNPYNQCANGVFPEDFMSTCRTIFKKLFRVYAHVYHHHLNVEFTKMGAEAHLNTTFKLFVLFEREFKMINRKEELPLRKLIQRLVEEDDDDSSPDDMRSIMGKSINSVSYRRNVDSS
ncbi:kinase activator [Blastocystis sp. subtype 4]|uniref:kinase activator n=1 Tax=Blastocystis sp. subtype 4 TaxID=944170 RepID=UPI0007113448|nr:kinase activator [Blastocystis sp. subtype 4]KNB46478.1 kinase activator [Blastocystis sp. subtype 4]|eukprot:XP_014529908.1 kinase activator [Blastocystis sp. subtype 4]